VLELEPRTQKWELISRSGGEERIEELKATEAQLLARAAAADGRSIEEVVREGALRYAKTLLSRSLSDAQRGNHKRLLAAHRALSKKMPAEAITAAPLAKQANAMAPDASKIAFRTARHWLERHG